MKLTTLIVGALASRSLAAPTPGYEVHERRDFIPKSWVEEKRLDAAAFLPVRIGLTQNNLDYGHELLMEM
jgi:tripeptidyl-peptidase-1